MNKKIILGVFSFLSFIQSERVRYSLISTNGDVHVFKNGNDTKDGQEVFKIAQGRNYDIMITNNGTLTFNDVGLAGGNYGWIRDIQNQCRYNISIDQKDDNDSLQVSGLRNQKYECHKTVPWDNNPDHHFFLTIDYTPEQAQSGVVNYSFLSVSGSAKVFKGCSVVADKAQRRNYDLLIGNNGELTFNDIGLAGGDYAWINNIDNPFGHSLTLSYQDDGAPFNLTNNSDCRIEFKRSIPWDNKPEHTFNLSIKLATQKSLKADRSYTLVSDGGYVFIEDHVSAERIDDSLGQYATYDLTIGPRGTLVLDYVGNLPGQNIAMIRNIYNPCGYEYQIEYNDSNAGGCNRISSAAQQAYNKPVPWKGGSNTMKVTIQLPTYNGKPLYNGYPELGNKPVNLVTVVKTHDAASYKAQPGVIDCTFKINDQSRTFKQQLYDGVRACILPLFRHNVDGKDQLYACHGNMSIKAGQPCDIDPARTPLLQLMTTLREYLDKYPSEVFVLHLRDERDFGATLSDDETHQLDAGSASADVQNKFKTFTAFDKAGVDMLDKIFNDSGLKKYMYDPASHKDGTSWPTLQELVKTNKRVIVILSDGYYENQPGVFFASKTIVGTPYGFNSLDALKNSTPTPSSSSNPGKMFYDLTHNVTAGFAGCIDYAREANKKDLVKKHADQFKGLSGYYPSWIGVDFYQAGGWGAFLAANEMNGISYK